MDPVSIIVAALTGGAAAAGAGTAAGITDASKSAVASIYDRLKVAISAQAKTPAEVEKTLERHESDPVGYAVPVRDLVVETGVDRNAAVVALAEQILTLLADGSQGDTTLNSSMHAFAQDGARIFQAGRDQHIGGGN